MKIVIDIREEDYKAIAKGYLPYGAIADAIKNGIPLPEHHGRLIDADALDFEEEVNLADDWRSANSIAQIVKDAPTIIERSDAE